MRITTFLLFFTGLAGVSQAQNIGINLTGVAAVPSAMLDIDNANKGLLIPRVALTATNAVGPVAAPANSLLVYNTATAGAAPNNVTPGFYYYETASSTWVPILAGVKGWSILGNSGTTPGTNFIGTTDARDFVVKTGGSAATNERMRVLATGPSVINNTTAYGGDVFSVYGSGTTNGVTTAISALGSSVVNSYAAGNGIGVYGETSSATTSEGVGVFWVLSALNLPAINPPTSSNGVLGMNTASPLGTAVTAGLAIGVEGDAFGTPGFGRTIGVAGFTTSLTGSAFGLYGQTSSANGYAVLGINADAGANFSHGIQGQTSGIGGAAGLRGYNTSATSLATGRSVYGIRGTVLATNTAGTAFGTAVAGDVGATTGTFYGVSGFVQTAGGIGVVGSNGNVASGIGMVGLGNGVTTYIAPANGAGGSFAGTRLGLYSISSNVAAGIGLMAAGNGVNPIAPTMGCGIVGTGRQYGVMGFTNISTATVNPGGNNSAGNLANAASGGYFELLNGLAPVSWAYVGMQLSPTNVLYKIHGNGIVGTIVKDTEDQYVGLACPEAPEALFQDYGNAKLENGTAHVSIDPIFSKNIVVNDKHPLRVFVQLEGDCSGVYVTNKTATGFDVMELAGGTSNVAFSYTIVANRADEVNADGSVSKYSGVRFAAAPGPVQKETMRSEAREFYGATKSDSEEIPLPVSKSRERPKKEK